MEGKGASRDEHCRGVAGDAAGQPVHGADHVSAEGRDEGRDRGHCGGAGLNQEPQKSHEQKSPQLRAF